MPNSLLAEIQDGCGKCRYIRFATIGDPTPVFRELILYNYVSSTNYKRAWLRSLGTVILCGH